jgi:hypothetical protein
LKYFVWGLVDLKNIDFELIQVWNWVQRKCQKVTKMFGCCSALILMNHDGTGWSRGRSVYKNNCDSHNPNLEIGSRLSRLAVSHWKSRNVLCPGSNLILLLLWYFKL